MHMDTNRLIRLSDRVKSTMNPPTNSNPHRSTMIRAGLAAALLAGSFIAPAFTKAVADDGQVIPAAWAYPAGSQDASAPGFAGRVHQARRNANLSATVARGNAQLSGALIDPQSGQPYLNLAVTTTNEVAAGGAWTGFPVDPGGAFAETNVVNYSADDLGSALDLGQFRWDMGYADAAFPGLPGSNDDTFTIFGNASNFAIEEMAFLELKAGSYVFGVNCDDTFELSIHPNDARDIFRKPLAAFGSNRGTTETTAAVQVQADGLYSVRLLHAQYQNSPPAELEFYTVDPGDPNTRFLVNDRTLPNAVKAWRALNGPARPYIKGVEPAPDSTGVPPDAPVRVVLAQLGTTIPVMKVNGKVVAPLSSASGNETTLTYTPVPAFSGGVVQVEVEYAGAVGAWSFVTRTGVKALMIVGGTATASDNWMAARLGSEYGLDVTVKTDSAVQTNDAAGCVLIVNSATVNSGNVAPKNFEELNIPILNGEQANVDDFLMGATGGNIDLSELEIVDGSHPIAGGLEPGIYAVYNAGVVNQCHWAAADEASAVVGVVASNQNPLIFAVEEGAVILDLIHPARRVHLGIVGNDGANRFNDTGVKLFDAAVRWLLKLPAEALQFNPLTLADGKVTISWKGSGMLQEAATVVGPWQDAASQANPQLIAASGARFYRLRP